MSVFLFIIGFVLGILLCFALVIFDRRIVILDKNTLLISREEFYRIQKIYEKVIKKYDPEFDD
jgi:hypothetical protein